VTCQAIERMRSPCPPIRNCPGKVAVLSLVAVHPGGRRWPAGTAAVGPFDPAEAHSSDEGEQEAMKLGIDTYSLRWQGWSAFQFLEYSAKIGLDNVHFSDRENLASLEPGYLAGLRRRADELGLGIELGFGSFDRFSTGFRAEWGSGEQQLSDMLRAAKAVDSPVLRCFLGSQNERLGPVPIEQHVEECVRTLKAVAPLARDLGVKVALENHGGIDLLAREMKALVEAAGTDYVGVCYDSGNPAYAAEDPLLTMEILAPYVVSSHIRDTRVWSVPEGALAQWVPLGEGNTDVRRIVGLMREHAPHAICDLEIITCIEPKLIPYLQPESDFWRMYPNMLARDFARFVGLAASGKPEPLDQLALKANERKLPDGELGERFKTQQLRHFESSVRFARETLGIGERGR
jgi:3-oxoisoapionate decarboxylase